MFWSLALSSLVVFATTCLAYPNPGTVSGDTAIHDPTLTRDSAGKYWLFGKLLSNLQRGPLNSIENSRYWRWYSDPYIYGQNCLDVRRSSLAKRRVLDRYLHRNFWRVGPYICGCTFDVILAQVFMGTWCYLCKQPVLCEWTIVVTVNYW